jgi:hypothetical protein
MEVFILFLLSQAVFKIKRRGLQMCNRISNNFERAQKIDRRGINIYSLKKAIISVTLFTFLFSRAVAQAAIRRLPTAAACLEPGSSHVEFVVDTATLRQVSPKYFGFPCHSFIPPVSPQSTPSIIQAWYNRPVNDCRSSGLGSSPVPNINKKQCSPTFRFMAQL